MCLRVFINTLLIASVYDLSSANICLLYFDDFLELIDHKVRNQYLIKPLKGRRKLSLGVNQKQIVS